MHRGRAPPHSLRPNLSRSGMPLLGGRGTLHQSVDKCNEGRKTEMKSMRSQRGGYGLLIMIAAPLLALPLGGVGWASVCDPGMTPFLELDPTTTTPPLTAKVGFDGLVGASFDWANSGANSQSCSYATNPIVCSGSGGIFDDSSGCTAAGFAGSVPVACCSGAGTGTCGSFNGATTPPTAPVETTAAQADSSILAASFGVDPLSVDVTACGLGDPTVYTGTGGETNGDPLASETFATGSVPNKDEISNVYAISHQNPVNPDLASCAGCVPGSGGLCTTAPCNTNSNCSATNEIYAGFERVVNNGDTHVDFEFLQSAVTLVPGSKPAAFPCAGNFAGDRTKGDVLLSVDFTKGGKVGSPVIHVWDCGTLTPSPSGVCNPLPGLCSVTTTTTCNTNTDCPTGETCVRKKGSPSYVLASSAAITSAVQQRVNDGGPVGCGGWGCRNANGTQATSINTVEFYEVGIDLAALGFTGCIHTFLPHTRSSQSFTATLKDFEVVSFNTCRGDMTVTKSCDSAVVNPAGTGVDVSISGQVCNTGNVELSNISLTNNQPGTDPPPVVVPVPMLERASPEGQWA
jgi:hypothetical protein